MTLGIFFRLYTLLEDECQKLDIKMAAIISSSPGDRQTYLRYSEVVFKERQLLDKKDATEKHLTLMQQTLTYLAINSANPSTDPAIRCISSTIEANKRQLESIVSKMHTSKISNIKLYYRKKS